MVTSPTGIFGRKILSIPEVKTLSPTLIVDHLGMKLTSKFSASIPFAIPGVLSFPIKVENWQIGLDRRIPFNVPFSLIAIPAATFF